MSLNETKTQRSKYASEEEARQARREAQRRYMQSEAGRAKKRETNYRYSQSEGGKAKLKELKAKYRSLARQQKKSICAETEIEDVETNI